MNRFRISWKVILEALGSKFYPQTVRDRVALSQSGLTHVKDHGSDSYLHLQEYA